MSYRDIITEATGETGEVRLAVIEDLLRHGDAHLGTLDWVPADRLMVAAHYANTVEIPALEADGISVESYYATCC